MESQIKAANKLIQDIDKKLKTTESRTSALKGVKNLPVATLEQIKFYAETLIRTGGFYGLMAPRGEVKQVFEKYGISIEH